MPFRRTINRNTSNYTSYNKTDVTPTKEIMYFFDFIFHSINTIFSTHKLPFVLLLYFFIFIVQDNFKIMISTLYIQLYFYSI